ncbi:hypothetical protein J6590_031167 [Homalodisca vitripennis]|nr:hypothetical protein J6590_031167 [Homalodisca vitripennis]
MEPSCPLWENISCLDLPPAPAFPCYFFDIDLQVLLKSITILAILPLPKQLIFLAHSEQGYRCKDEIYKFCSIPSMKTLLIKATKVPAFSEQDESKVPPPTFFGSVMNSKSIHYSLQANILRIDAPTPKHLRCAVATRRVKHSLCPQGGKTKSIKNHPIIRDSPHDKPATSCLSFPIPANSDYTGLSRIPENHAALLTPLNVSCDKVSYSTRFTCSGLARANKITFETFSAKLVKTTLLRVSYVLPKSQPPEHADQKLHRDNDADG